ncbi:hypothetical protein B0I37DRAFT_350875 [Chaetomium sp. MPI-CAGE-AT-0009]|nr:hypothetical protein B0I37DRAFT_350875 [Chaetomium sp. MPI-CAGE-AT-0009]
MKVAIVGATGETGSSIVNGLLESTEPRYEITALIRPSSLGKASAQELRKKGVNVVAADLTWPEDKLAELLHGIEVVISAIYAANLLSQIPLANASKAAGVSRFVPCDFATVAPPKGVIILRDIKEEVLNHIKKIYLPYTVIDVGWWYQLTLPRLPSGRIDYALMPGEPEITGDGNTPSALTDIGDIGRYTARIIADPRTLNHMVFAYSVLYTQNQVYDLIEKLSGEKIERKYVSAKTIQALIADAEAEQDGPPSPNFKLVTYQYRNSWGIRGDNTPEHAEYLGYLNANELFPDLKVKSFEAYCKEVLDGKAYAVYR